MQSNATRYLLVCQGSEATSGVSLATVTPGSSQLAGYWVTSESHQFISHKGSGLLRVCWVSLGICQISSSHSIGCLYLL